MVLNESTHPQVAAASQDIQQCANQSRGEDKLYLISMQTMLNLKLHIPIGLANEE